MIATRRTMAFPAQQGVVRSSDNVTWLACPTLRVDPTSWSSRRDCRDTETHCESPMENVKC